MSRKKQIVTMVSIAIISFLVGTTVNFVAAAGDGNPFDKIWQAISNLQTRVTALEQGTSTKTWHFVTSFTLSPEERVSPLFFIQGEKWRIKWQPQAGHASFWIWDENGYVIDFVNISKLLEIHHDAHGIHYVPHGEGSYYLEFEYVVTESMNFTIESYH